MAEEEIEMMIKMIMSTVEHKIELEDNVKFIHINGGKKEYMCKYCFNKGYMGIKEIMEREIKQRSKRRENKAWREKELKEWSESVYRKIRESTFNWKEHYEKLNREGPGIKKVKMYLGEHEIYYIET